MQQAYCIQAWILFCSFYHFYLPSFVQIRGFWEVQYLIYRRKTHCPSKIISGTFHSGKRWWSRQTKQLDYFCLVWIESRFVCFILWHSHFQNKSWKHIKEKVKLFLRFPQSHLRKMTHCWWIWASAGMLGPWWALVSALDEGSSCTHTQQQQQQQRWQHYGSVSINKIDNILSAA